MFTYNCFWMCVVQWSFCFSIRSSSPYFFRISFIITKKVSLLFFLWCMPGLMWNIWTHKASHTSQKSVVSSVVLWGLACFFPYQGSYSHFFMTSECLFTSLNQASTGAFEYLVTVCPSFSPWWRSHHSGCRGMKDFSILFTRAGKNHSFAFPSPLSIRSHVNNFL